YPAFSALEVSATLYNFDLIQKLTKKANVDVGPDGKALAFKLEWPDGLSKTFFVKLELRDPTGLLRSQNFYWLSTTPDIPGSGGRDPAPALPRPPPPPPLT